MFFALAPVAQICVAQIFKQLDDALLGRDFGVLVVHTRRILPVKSSSIIPDLILPRFGKLGLKRRYFIVHVGKDGGDCGFCSVDDVDR